MSFMNKEANKQEAERYVKMAANAAANGDVDKAERMLTIAENIYSTPLGRKILHDIQSSRVERHDIHRARLERRPSKLSFCSESSSGSCVCSSSEECRKSPNDSVSSEDDYEYTGNVLQTAYHHQRHPINIRNFDDAYMSLDKADEYFAMAQQELTKKSKNDNKPKLEEYGFENPTSQVVEVNDGNTKVKKKHHHSQSKENHHSQSKENHRSQSKENHHSQSKENHHSQSKEKDKSLKAKQTLNLDRKEQRDSKI